MDVITSISSSASGDEFVAAVIDCKSTLLEEAKKKFGSRTEVVDCKVHVGPKILPRFQGHELWKSEEEPPEDESIPAYRRSPRPNGIELVADFSLFKLHLTPIMGDDQIRVVCNLKSPDSHSLQVWFGNVEVVK